MPPFRRLNSWWVGYLAFRKLSLTCVLLASVDSMWMIFSGFLQLSISAFQDLPCMFRQVGVYFACGLLHRLAYLGRYFFSLLRFLLECHCLNLCEHLSVMKETGSQVCLSAHLLPYELRVARFSVSGSCWKLLASYCYHLLVGHRLFCRSSDSIWGMTSGNF